MWTYSEWVRVWLVGADFAYQEAFLATYRTWVSAAGLVERLLRRARHFRARPHELRSTLSLLTRVVADLTWVHSFLLLNRMVNVLPLWKITVVAWKLYTYRKRRINSLYDLKPTLCSVVGKGCCGANCTRFRIYFIWLVLNINPLTRKKLKKMEKLLKHGTDF